MHEREQVVNAAAKQEGVAHQPRLPVHERATEQATSHSSGLTPDDLMSLQRSAGNSAVARTLRTRLPGRTPGPGAGDASAPRTVQRRKPTANAPKEHFATKANDHPEWPLFQELMQKGGFPSEVTENAWQLVLGGLVEQDQLNQESADTSIDPAERRARRASNSWYRELVNLVGDHLRVTTPTMALWSGGFDVSKYAQSKGHTSLEFTRLGKIVDQLELHANWKLQAPLWNVLSRAFVERATGPVHVFLRAYNPDSVLIAQEIPQLRIIQKLNPAVELLWHPLYTNADGTIKEISPNLQLTDDAAYRSRDKCVSVMYNYLLRIHDTNNNAASMAYKEMNELLEGNVNPKAQQDPKPG
ncbi:hypothetical protein [Streptomyces niger]|uniref:hypothetical protein n=1 Tax=Streptomyces niger TaxID=66373 RepID=UPI0018FE742B|nr:hypothetical protein [Streptomyces niger]